MKLYSQSQPRREEKYRVTSYRGNLPVKEKEKTKAKLDEIDFFSKSIQGEKLRTKL